MTVNQYAILFVMDNESPGRSNREEIEKKDPLELEIGHRQLRFLEEEIAAIEAEIADHEENPPETKSHAAQRAEQIKGEYLTAELLLHKTVQAFLTNKEERVVRILPLPNKGHPAIDYLIGIIGNEIEFASPEGHSPTHVLETMFPTQPDASINETTNVDIKEAFRSFRPIHLIPRKPPQLSVVPKESFS